MNIFVDPINKGKSHLYFNNAIINSTKPPFNVVCNKTHITELIKLNKRIIYKTYNTSSHSLNILKCIFHLFKYPKNNNRKIIFLAFDNFFVPSLLLLFYPIFKKDKFIFFIHNNLNSLIHSPIKKDIHKLLIRIYHPDIIVLTKRMKELYLKQILNYNRLIFIPHPNYRNQLKLRTNNKLNFNLENKTNKYKINISVVGRQASLIKDFISKYDIAELYNLNFTIVINNNYQVVKNKDNITYIIERINYNQYFNLLKNSDYVLFGLDSTSAYRASGVLMDCISVETAIIAPNIGHFEEYKNFNIGYFYNDYDSLYQILKYLQSENGYSIESLNFEKALKYSEPINFPYISEER